MGFGCKNWGEGAPDEWSDVNMVPESDVDIYGPNKFFLEPKTCPASSGACDFNITLTTSNANPQLTVPFTLTANCVGSESSREPQIFPSPSKGKFEVEFYLKKDQSADLTVTSVAGQTLQKRSVIGKGIQRQKFDIGSAAPSMHLQCH